MTGAAAPAPGLGPIDVEVLRKDFPLLSRTVHDRPIVYLDSAATALQPRQVLAAMDHYYETTHANVHRGVYATAEEATRLYEQARVDIGRFIGAPDPAREIVFTKNATESLNLVAHSWGRPRLAAGDVVLLTEMEHHANIVPWLMLADERGVELRYLPVDDDGRLDLSGLDRALDGVKLVGVSAMSNVLGTINPLPEIARAAHAVGALVVADGAQLVPHLPVDVVASGADFLAFSAHKMLGPTGIGVLWARAELLEAMPPFLGGGGMILDVRTRPLPGRRPAPAVRGRDAAHRRGGRPGRRRRLPRGPRHGTAPPARAEPHGLRPRGPGRPARGPTAGSSGHRPATTGAGCSPWPYRDVHPHDLAQVLDQFGVCVRPGHHCAKPLMRRLGVPATARASIGPYNDEHDIDVLIEGLIEAGRLFG